MNDIKDLYEQLTNIAKDIIQELSEVDAASIRSDTKDSEVHYLLTKAKEASEYFSSHETFRYSVLPSYSGVVSFIKNLEQLEIVSNDKTAQLFRFFAQKKSIDNFLDHISNFKALLRQLLLHLTSEEISRLSDQIGSKNTFINNYERNVKGLIEKHSEILFEAQKKDIERTINADSKRIHDNFEETTQKIISSFEIEINRIQSKYEKGLKGFNHNFLKDIKETTDGLNIDKENFARDIKETIDGINREKDKFEARRSDMDKLLEKVGLAKDAEVTIEQANKEEAAANELRKYGIWGLWASIVTLIVLFSEYLGNIAPWNDTQNSLSDLTFEAFSFRFMTVLLVSSPAIYLLKESAAHRAKENLYRQRGTQLLTIRGYLADLSDKHRAEVKQSLAENFFSFHDGKADVNNVPDFLKNMQEAIALAKKLDRSTADTSDNSKSPIITGRHSH